MRLRLGPLWVTSSRGGVPDDLPPWAADELVRLRLLSVEAGRRLGPGWLLEQEAGYPEGVRSPELPGLTWSCHFCGDVRPDAEISVATAERTLGPSEVAVRHTRRYCNDRERCRVAAAVWSVHADDRGRMPT